MTMQVLSMVNATIDSRQSEKEAKQCKVQSRTRKYFFAAQQLTLVCGKMFEVNAHSERRFRKLHFAKVNAHSSGEFHATLCRNGH